MCPVILTPQEEHLQESQEPEQLQVEQELQSLVRLEAFPTDKCQGRQDWVLPYQGDMLMVFGMGILEELLVSVDVVD